MLLPTNNESAQVEIGPKCLNVNHTSNAQMEIVNWVSCTGEQELLAWTYNGHPMSSPEIYQCKQEVYETALHTIMDDMSRGKSTPETVMKEWEWQKQ